jgi:hypothetical protein
MKMPRLKYLNMMFNIVNNSIRFRQKLFTAVKKDLLSVEQIEFPLLFVPRTADGKPPVSKSAAEVVYILL